MKKEIVELPSFLRNFLQSKGIHQLYPPQIEALKSGVLKGKNLVLASHTASGKTLIAEMVMLKRFYEGNLGKAVYMVPLRAIASEKYNEFKELQNFGLKVALTTGDYDTDDAHLKYYDVIITTNEKFDSLLRHKPLWLNDVSLAIIDEIHYIDDVRRGPVIEGVISRLKKFKNIQFLALSATVSNVKEIAEWLNAEYVLSEWRPVPLREGIYYNGIIKFNDGTKIKIKRRYQDDLVDLVYDTLANKGQALIFTSTRALAVRLAEKIARKLGGSSLDFLLDEKVKDLMDKLRNSSNVRSLNDKLASLAARGVIFHHAGLTYVQRKTIEDSFREGTLKVIVATPTLAAGVNLPARRVIIHSYLRYEYGYGNIPIKTMEYKQMSGRAGRPGFDEYGEAIIIARTEFDVDKLWRMYVNSKPETLFSKLGRENALRNFALTVIATEFASSIEDIIQLFKYTLHYLQFGSRNIEDKIYDVMEFLRDEEFIIMKREKIKATTLGKRVSELYVDPLSATIYVKGLRNISDINRISDVGLLMLASLAPDMPKLSLKRQEFIEIDYLLDKYYDTLPLDPYSVNVVNEYTIASSMKTAMLLYDWINEVHEEKLASKYGIGPGDIHGLVETAEWLIYSLKEIAKVIHKDLHTIGRLEILRRRIKYGVKEELLELVKLSGVGRIRARSLYSSGFKSIKDLANAKISDLSKLHSIGEELAIKIIEQAKSLRKTIRLFRR